MSNECDRRYFIKLGTAIGTGLALGSVNLTGCAPELRGIPGAIRPPKLGDKTIRVGFVGIGARGSYLYDVVQSFENVQVSAVCDINPQRTDWARKRAVEKGRPEPVAYTRGDTDFKRMCENEDLDLVVTATPVEWHTPVSVAAMNAGKHVAPEVPACYTVDEAWSLVEASEKNNRHCYMLENVCYFREMLMVLNMVRKGLFGELVHCAGGYQHESRAARFDDNRPWVGEVLTENNGNFYPTHPLGPIAQWMDINRGDRFDYLVSVSSKAVGLKKYATEHFGVDSAKANRNFRQGDVNTTIIRTVKGQTITLYYDLSLPRPYDLMFRCQGTLGIYMHNMQKIFFEGKSHSWDPLDKYRQEHEHPLWKKLGPVAQNYGHGGGDYIQFHRLFEALRTGNAPDMDVYDAASWSAICGLTARSVANRGSSVDIPDFTRDKWKTNTPLGIVEPVI